MMLEEEDAEKSCWETSSLESLAKLKLDFTFVHGLEQVAAAEDPHIVPCDIAYHPTRCRNRQAILNLGNSNSKQPLATAVTSRLLAIVGGLQIMDAYPGIFFL